MQDCPEALIWAAFGQTLHRVKWEWMSEWAEWVFLPREEIVTAKFPERLYFYRKENINFVAFL